MYTCIKCKGKSFYIRDVGKHRGLYCFDCGMFLKWTTKAEIYHLTSKHIIKGGDDYKN